MTLQVVNYILLLFNYFVYFLFLALKNNKGYALYIKGVIRAYYQTTKVSGI